MSRRLLPTGRHACVRLGKQSTGCLLLQVAPIKRSSAYQTRRIRHYFPRDGMSLLARDHERKRARVGPRSRFLFTGDRPRAGQDWSHWTRSRSNGRRRGEARQGNGRKSLRTGMW